MENIRLRVRERVRKYKRRDCCDSENFLERERERAKKKENCCSKEQKFN